MQKSVSFSSFLHIFVVVLSVSLNRELQCWFYSVAPKGKCGDSLSFHHAPIGVYLWLIGLETDFEMKIHVQMIYLGTVNWGRLIRY